jgi:hypothetical protein
MWLWSLTLKEEGSLTVRVDMLLSNACGPLTEGVTRSGDCTRFVLIATYHYDDAVRG